MLLSNFTVNSSPPVYNPSINVKSDLTENWVKSDRYCLIPLKFCSAFSVNLLLVSTIPDVFTPLEFNESLNGPEIFQNTLVTVHKA